MNEWRFNEKNEFLFSHGEKLTKGKVPEDIFD